MTLTTNPVKDYPNNFDPLIKGLVTQNQWGDASRHATTVNHQHNREVKFNRQGGVTVTAVRGHSIVEPFIAFKQSNMGFCRMNLPR